MRDFTKLDAWRLARELVIDVYAASDGFPKRERYELTRQLRRATTSIPANIAEGSGRSTPKDAARSLDIACGSANEVENHLIIARDLGFLSLDQAKSLIATTRRVRSMCTGLAKSVRLG